MRVLVVKMSSFGDVIHTLPAVTDLKTLIPEVEIDWVVEEAFTDIVRLHFGVDRVIPVAIRRWRSSWITSLGEIARFRRQLREKEYDIIIDAQGLLKSALVSWVAKGSIHGLDAASIKEAIACSFYQQTHAVAKSQHAVTRVRQLFSDTFEYELTDLPAGCGLAVDQPQNESKPRLLFLHGTTWSTKHWPEEYWCELAIKAADQGFQILLPHGDDLELQRADRIAERIPNNVTVLARASIGQLAEQMSSCAGVVTVDTGLGHLAAALDVPLVAIYGATDPKLTGPYGSVQSVLVSDHLPCIPCLKKDCQFQKGEEYSSIHPPCYQKISPEVVFDKLSEVISKRVMDD
ncbi:MAG TPA: lipopolysaccharide heptosyltransferase I [Pseudomonadales bacterium]|nr:lipopolysaccharide heptosyltransferase I [Gammaproteobacteria bacterium]MDP7314402.1 lipopolysaccharide heptosyltransferase I [Pseudomonadales bacterium]MDP7575602.1 lipopolysaccharide heptosyltransferase I [Pseudomonadales bacterium]HJL62442.1 lipopolysaccharide heptosyltransferase I [Pseudomonadales bacterium]